MLTQSPVCLNVVSFQAYGKTPTAIREAAREIRSRYGLSSAISEWGVPTHGSSTTSPADQARKTAAFLASVDTLEMPLVSIYEWKDSLHAPNDRERSFGVVDASGARKPVFDTVASYLTNAAARR
ncbi:hypothetical protein BRCH_03225c [Candidatus Burkholderia brachyanthoides]|nr:hypothetical protein BRCH_03225c [Candidatus Burkholderia brachyanthoides]